MTKRLIDLGARPLLDLTSYARPGPGRHDRISTAEIDHITRTARRVPEVMVKVLTNGRQDLKAVQRHLAYLDRKGALPIETDEGERIQGRAVEKDLLGDWDLDIEEYRRRADLGPRKDRSPPKLVHKVLFSMPPGTPPEKVLKAVRNFAREEFALKHRYAMVLHTDEPHPHVHVVIKAVSEQGARLNKGQLQATRQEVVQGWGAVSEILVSQGQFGLAAEVRELVRRMPPPLTEQEQVARTIISRRRSLSDPEPTMSR